MLVGLTIRNFRSFRDEQAFSMQAVNRDADCIDDNTFRVAALGNRRLLRSSVVYGANAAGKSNLVRAFGFIQSAVTRSTETGLERAAKAEPFRLDPGVASQPSAFECSLVARNVRYDYGFAVSGQRIAEEWLVAYPRGYPQKWFRRTSAGDGCADDWYFGPMLLGSNARLRDLTRPDSLFLSVAARFNHKQLTPVYEWFARSLLVIDISQIPLEMLDLRTRIRVENDVDFRAKVTELLRQADLGIVDMHVDGREWKLDEFVSRLRLDQRAALDQLLAAAPGQGKAPPKAIREVDIQLRHRAKGQQSSVGLEFSTESMGTRKLFLLSGPWLEALASGAALVVDELSSSLHPHIVRHLVSMFHSPLLNPLGAQLVFNSHDADLLDAGLFRRDQVWMVEKDNEGASHLYPLSDFRPRKDEALGKGYLRGRYGAIPILEGPSFLSGAGEHAPG